MNSCEKKVLGLSYQYIIFSHIFYGSQQGSIWKEDYSSDLKVHLILAMTLYQKNNFESYEMQFFARHGRQFKSSDLQDFFYGPDAPERFKNVKNTQVEFSI